jgi:predicted TIM-barrel fold metal-dependent hydrolase
MPVLPPAIIDFHVHLSRSVNEEKLVYPRKAWPDEWYWGNPEGVIPYMDGWNVSHIVILNVMDTQAMIARQLDKNHGRDKLDAEELKIKMRDRVRRFNTWACDVHRSQSRIIPFVFADPVLFGEGVTEEIDRCVKLGARGIKVHPNICRHFPDDERALALYDYCATQGIPVLTETSGDLGANGEPFGAPVGWQPVLRQFKDLQLVLAHLCGERWDEHLVLAKEFKDNIFWDMSCGLVDETHPVSVHRQMPIREGARVFRTIGTDRILFGTDGPALRHEVPDIVCQLFQLGLTDEENQRILHDNAASLLHVNGF